MYPTACRAGSPGSCKLKSVNVPGYSAGGLVHITSGHKISKSIDKNSCPVGWKIWAPQNKADWTIVYNAMSKNIKNYPKAPYLIIDVTRSSNGCGGCTGHPMKSGVSQQSVGTPTTGLHGGCGIANLTSRMEIIMRTATCKFTTSTRIMCSLTMPIAIIILRTISANR